MPGCDSLDLCCRTPLDVIRQVLKAFKGVEHRLEKVRTIHGVTYYNDSKGTNVDASMKALEAFPQGHLILIAGGYDKKTPLDDFMALAAKRVDTLILIGVRPNASKPLPRRRVSRISAALVTAWKGPSCWPAKLPRHRRRPLVAGLLEL